VTTWRCRSSRAVASGRQVLEQGARNDGRHHRAVPTRLTPARWVDVDDAEVVAAQLGQRSEIVITDAAQQFDGLDERMKGVGIARGGAARTMVRAAPGSGQERRGSDNSSTVSGSWSSIAGA